MRTLPTALAFVVTAPAAIGLLAGPFRTSPVERWQQTLRFAPGGPRVFEIDNVRGSIDVTTHDVPTADVVVSRVVSARSDEALAAAERDVRLLVTDDGPTVRLYVDGPFRHDTGPGRRQDWKRPEYDVRYNFTARVPRDAALRLRTVNGGYVRVRGVSAGFHLRNVNGDIELDDMTGSGDARTVNGHVRASFHESPRDALRLATLNGDLVVRFLQPLSADVWLKTGHGKAVTDYDFTRLPSRPPVAEQRGTMRVWKTSSFTGLRVGGGGPSIELETFNGDIGLLRSGS